MKEKAKKLERVASIEEDVYGNSHAAQNVEEDDLLMLEELNNNRYYRNFVEGMDESGSSFYIDDMKTQVQKKRIFEQRQLENKRVETLKLQLKSANKGNISLREMVRRGSQSVARVINDSKDIVKVI